MSLRAFICIGLIGSVLMACSTGPSPSNCYGKGQPGCEAYWKDGPPKSVVVEATINDDFVKKFKIPDKQKYIDRDGTTPPKRWKKAGVSDLETRKALLECGSGVYAGKNAYELMKTLTLTQYDHGLVLIKKCMLVDGFEYLGNADLCASLSIPACQPDTIIPAREVERRINGAYCIDAPYLNECQPQSYERRRDSAFCKKYPQRDICQPSVQSPTKQLTPQSIQNNSANPYAYPNEYPDKTQQLQQDMQRDSNRDMKNLLRNTAPKAGR